ncbi:MAG: bifunctional oligoribonuclease/PAP phosphatase NrnA [Acidobacteriota bacterium]
MVLKEEIIELFTNNSEFVITTHISPDGDGIGSALALKRGLNLINKKAYIVNHSKTPKNLSFLLQNEKEILSLEEFQKEIKLKDYVSVVVDMGCFERLGSVLDLIKMGREIVIIDHHIVEVPENVFSLIDTKASATGEVVFDLLNRLKVPLGKEVAEPLYTAIETDTGGFRFSGTTPKTHLVVSKLLETGIDPSYIHTQLYEKESPTRIRVLGEVLSTLSLTPKGKIAYMQLRQDMLKKLNAKIEDGDDLVNYLMIIEGVEAGFYFKEISENVTKVSCRSRGKINLDKFLSQWGGGGHPQAAGLLMKENISIAISIIISKASEIIEK